MYAIKMTFWMAQRCLQKDLIKINRFLVWHNNKKCLCKIRKAYYPTFQYAFWLSMDTSSVDTKHLSSVSYIELT